MGHKVISKTYAGETIKNYDGYCSVGREILLFKWENRKYCIRCGKENKE